MNQPQHLFLRTRGSGVRIPPGVPTENRLTVKVERFFFCRFISSYLDSIVVHLNLWEPLKTGVKSKNGQGVPASRKADEVRLYALRGGLTTKMVRTAHFRSHEVFRGDLI